MAVCHTRDMTYVRKPEHADKDVAIAGTSRFTLRRHCEGYAYPANGNAREPQAAVAYSA